MGFSISGWLMRRKIGAQVRMSGRPVEHRHVVNPYHAVSIEPGLKSCKPVREIDGKRFLASAAPAIPIAGCTHPASCKCRYLHYNDRRNPRDRRVQPHNPHAHKMNERRTGQGRRVSD